MESMLEKFFKDKNIKSLVIDGPWGCGKTYCVREFIKKHEKVEKINYVSLFGYDSIDEINSKLYFANHKIIGFLRRFDVVPRFVDLGVFGLVNISISQSLGWVLRIFEHDQKLKDYIVVFDDAERILDFSFDKIIGYFNSLIEQGCRIICIMSSDNMNDQNREIYERFKEKMFDVIYKVDKLDVHVLDTVFKKIKSNNIKDKYFLLDKNIRLARKVENLFENILNYLSSSKISLQKDDDYLIFTASLYAVIIVFGASNIEKLLKNEKYRNGSYMDTLINNLMHKYEAKIKENAKDMLHIPEVYKDFSMPGTIDSVCAAIDVLIYNSYGKLDSFFQKEEEEGYKILKKEFYYLSDVEKIQYCNEFIDYVHNKNYAWDNEAVKKFASIIAYTNFDFSDVTIEGIARKIIENPTGDSLDYTSTLSLLNQYLISFCQNSTDGKRVKAVVEKISAACKRTLQKSTTEEFNEAVANTDYIKLEALIQAKADTPQYLLELFKNNGFCLPDLTKTITHAEWRFCHSIATYVSATSYKDLFIRELVKIVETHKNSYSLNDRVFTLANVASENAFNSIDDLLSYKSVK